VNPLRFITFSFERGSSWISETELILLGVGPQRLFAPAQGGIKAELVASLL
jgi:hypothetical protein